MKQKPVKPQFWNLPSHTMLTCTDLTVQIEQVRPVLTRRVLQHAADSVQQGCSALLGDRSRRLLLLLWAREGMPEPCPSIPQQQHAQDGMHGEGPSGSAGRCPYPVPQGQIALPQPHTPREP